MLAVSAAARSIRHMAILPSSLSLSLISTSSLPSSSKSSSSSSLSSATVEAIDAHFPGSVSNSSLVSSVAAALSSSHGYGPSSTLVATSLCSDEINRSLERALAVNYGSDNNYFSMGGLAGFPFGGHTAFGAMASHIPDGGSALVVFGPHVGVDSLGNIGTVERRGRARGGACCGSAAAALAGVQAAATTTTNTLSDDEVHHADYQQQFVTKALLPFADHLRGENSTALLPYALYVAQKQLMDAIVKNGASGVAAPGKVAVLGGIQINVPPPQGSSHENSTDGGSNDLFLPLSLEVYDNSGQMVDNLSAEVGCGAAPPGVWKDLWNAA